MAAVCAVLVQSDLHGCEVVFDVSHVILDFDVNRSQTYVVIVVSVVMR